MQDCVRRFYEGVEPIAPFYLCSWTVTNILTHHSSIKTVSKVVCLDTEGQQLNGP